MQDEHPHVGAGIAGCDGLAVRPDAEHGVGGARIELGDDRDLHRAPPIGAARGPRDRTALPGFGRGCGRSAARAAVIRRAATIGPPRA